VKAKGEQSILYLIWHLLPDFPGVASSHIQKRITQRTLSLDGKRGSRATTFIRATGNTILLSSFCVRLFFFRLQSAEDGCERDTVGSDTQCANPNVLSKISDREKKEGRILSEDDDIFYALLNSLFRELFFPLLWFVLLLRLKTGRRELDGGRCERWRGLLAR
jgi:hypothetical protein